MFKWPNVFKLLEILMSLLNRSCCYLLTLFPTTWLLSACFKAVFKMWVRLNRRQTSIDEINQISFPDPLVHHPQLIIPFLHPATYLPVWIMILKKPVWREQEGVTSWFWLFFYLLLLHRACAIYIDRSC